MSASDQIALLAPMAEGPMAPLAQARLAALYFGRFQASRRLEDLQEARRRWQSLRRSHPDLQFPALNLATIALLDRQFDEATALLTGLRDAHSARTLPDTLLIQLLMVLAAVLARWIPILPFRICRYYLEVTLSIALGLWDRWRQGPPAAWEKAEGTR